MNAWQVEQIEEDARSRKWEQLNEADLLAHILKSAAPDVEKATMELDAAIDRLYDAQSALSETPLADVTQEFIDELIAINCSLTQTKARWEKGERE